MAAGPPVFTLYSRQGCHLCEDLLADLRSLPDARGYGLEVLDVDRDAEMRVRWGHKVPVLLFAGQLVCHGRLDPEEVRKSIALFG